MNRCRNCGAKFDGDVCPKCGTPVYTDFTNEEDQFVTLPGMHEDKAGGGVKAASKKKVLAIALPVVLVICIAVALVLVFSVGLCSTEKDDFASEDSNESIVEIEDGTSGGLAYTKNGSYAYEVTGIGTCTDKEIVIQSSYMGVPVTSIGSSAFSGCTSITSVTIPSSVTSIGDSAFSGCTSLTSTDIPDSVTSIGRAAFSGCSSLVSMTVPFVGGSSDASSASESSLFGYVFGTSSFPGGTATKQYYSNSYATSYYIPSKLKSVTVTGGKLLYGSFYGCANITGVTLGDSVTSVGSYAFYNCTALISVAMGRGVASLGTYAFYGCTALTDIFFDAAEMSGLSSGNYVFYNAGRSGSGVTLTVGPNVTKIPAYLFYPYSNSSYAPKLTAVVFEETSHCTEIGAYAFYNCSELISVVMPDSVTVVNAYAFDGCMSLSMIYYTGTPEEWNAVSVDTDGNAYLVYCTVYCYSETQPAENGNYWFYDDDGNPAIWRRT